MYQHFLLLLLASSICYCEAFKKKIRQTCNGDGSTIDCRHHAEISHLISSLKKEVRTLQLAQDPNCTVCWSGPCLNNGDCVPLNVTEYRCDCPQDYAGKICQTHVECKPDSCGVNADCYVANHQINCVCKFGYSGDARKGCTLKTVEACMSGDPHYRTFDGQYYEYMGTCPYVYVQPCNGSLPLPFEYFSVKAKNELTFPASHVSAVSEAEVQMYGQKLHVDSLYQFFFNGIRTSMPFYFPTRQNAKISVTFSNWKVVIANDQFVTVTFSYGSLCVQIPDDPLLQGADMLCGLAGNRDFDCRDDFRRSDGYVYENITLCSNRYRDFTEVFGDSYITDDFLLLKPESASCLTGQEVTNGSLTCDLTEAKYKCMPILDAVNGKGPFGACQGMGETAIRDAYYNCVFDVCQKADLLCILFTDFVKTCQSDLPNTPIEWRGEVGCPELHCPLHSTPKPCATGCPLSCENPDYTPECNIGCSEGCECDPGYFLDDIDPNNPQCVALSDCGCVDPQGNYHDGGDRWLTDNCTTVNSCDDGQFISETKYCSDKGHCALDDTRSYECECDPGYEGDGYFCSDIDECLDPATCSAGLGQGVCVNLPGTYECICDVYYQDGDNCATYLPLRHCADLYKYHEKRDDGVYTIKPPYPFAGLPAYSPLDVVCNMTMDGGGWTLMANSLSDSMSNRTFEEYEKGFGEPALQDLWLGLELINKMTSQVNTSLYVSLYRCASRRKPAIETYCAYPEFRVLSDVTNYAVVIPYACDGTEVDYNDGWARWDTDVGPAFTAFDSQDAECSKYFLNTGWWFDTEHLCGPANLNGNRYACEDPPSSAELSRYLEWDANPVNKAKLYLRPALFPDYEVPVPKTTNEPKTTKIYEVTANEETTVGHEVTDKKESTIEATVREETTIGHEVTEKKEATIAPEVTVKEEATVGHEVTEKKEATIAPEVTIKEEATVGHEVTEKKEATIAPDVTVKEEATIGHEVTENKDPVITHEATTNIEVTVPQEPTVNEASRTIVREATANEKVTIAQEVTANKEITAGPEVMDFSTVQ